MDRKMSRSITQDSRLIPSSESMELELHNLSKNLESASNIHQLVKLLNTIDSKKKHVDNVLQKFTLKQSIAHRSSIRSLEVKRLEFTTTLSTSRTLRKTLDSASNLSSKITERVRLLDSEKSKIQLTRDYVKNVKILKDEIQIANNAIKVKNWLLAANSINTIRHLPEKLITDEYVEFIVPTSDIDQMPKILIDNWIEQLTDVFIKEFNNAARNKDVSTLTYYFQLFPLIGKDSLGLNCYSKFVCNIISEQSRDIIRSAQGRDVRPDFYAQILFQLFQTISEIVHQHSRIIKRYYGSEVIPYVLENIQNECDLQCGLIFDTFCDSKKLARVLDSVSKYDYPVLVNSVLNSANGGSSKNNNNNNNNNNNDDNNFQNNSQNFDVSLLEVENLIEELSTILNHWAMYCKFFVVTWNEAIKRDQFSSVYPPPLIKSTFMLKVKKTITLSFDALSTFALRRTIERAYQLEQFPDLDHQLTICVKYLSLIMRSSSASVTTNLNSLSPDLPPVSSMIDDITISLNLIMLQTISSGQATTIRAMISNVRRVLENDFLNILIRKLQDFTPRSNTLLLTSSAFQSLKNNIGLLNNGTSSASKLSSPRSGTPPIGNIGNNNSSSNATTGSNAMNALGALNNPNSFVRGATSALNAAININGTESENSTKLGCFIIILNSISTFDDYLKKLVGNIIQRLISNNLLILDEQEFNRSLQFIDQNPDSDFELMVNMDVNEQDSQQQQQQQQLPIQPQSQQQQHPSSISEGESNKDDSDSNTESKPKTRIVATSVYTMETRIKTLINALSSGFHEKSNSVVRNYIKVLYSQVFKFKIQKLINDTFKDGSYLISSTINNEDSSNIHESVTNFIREWNQLILPYLTTLTRSNFAILIDYIVNNISSFLESKIWSMDRKFNELGASILDRNISLIIGEITKIDYSLRNKFIRVTQIVMLMGLDDDEDIDDFADIDWALTPTERNKARNLRIDRK
ncbi:hypothetical protein B5S32_g1476 [[Candida] boidinii]|nr:hypothetical protein B5S32_g1476 [[Candida] boidinii]